MAHEKLRPQYLFDAEKIEMQKQLTPECFEDGKINFETLRQNLGDWTQNEEDPELEHFGLFWPGKRDARKAAALPPEGTLEPVWGDGLKADGTPDKDGTNDSKNVFIEGENLEVLKLLQKSYTGKIKMIYIDPPYNTGNDFVYDDNFTEPLQEYLRRTGQIDEEGKSLTTNKKSDGRFHSKWLSMMYPRLRLARNLLSDDGVIFASIDDNEIHNLRGIMNEIFGEENFICQAGWQKVYSPKNQARYLSNDYEYVLIYSKSIFNFQIGLLPRTEEMNKRYSDFDKDPRGPWKPGDLVASGERKGGHYIIKNPITGQEFDVPSGKHWAFSEETMKTMLEENRIFFGKGNNSYPSFKQFLSEVKQGRVPSSFFNYKDYGHTDEAKKDFIKLFGEEGRTIFETLKPVRLIQNLCRIGNLNDNDILLDFFGGSGTTMQAIYELNLEEKTNRKFICVQIPELTNETSEAFKSGYKSIAEISKTRAKKVSQKIQELGAKTDIGLKVVSLNNSNYKSWKNYQGLSIAALESKLSLFNENPLRDDYTKDGLLTEIMLLEGFTLCSTISMLSELKTNEIKKITCEYSEHALLVCLDEKINKETVTKLELGDNDIFICLDSAISTEDKLRLSDKGLIKTI